MYSFSYLEPVCCSMSSSNCCFLTCTYVSQEAGQVVWYAILFKNFPQFVVVHKVKDFGIVSKAEVDIFLELSCFFCDPTDVGNLISGFSAFSKSSLNIWSSFLPHKSPCWSLDLFPDVTWSTEGTRPKVLPKSCTVSSMQRHDQNHHERGAGGS